MNLAYWDKHKVACIVGMALMVVSFGVGWVAIGLEDVAWERASNALSYDDVQSVLKYLDAYENHLPPQYSVLDSLGTWMIWIQLAVVIYAGLTALYIPERYRNGAKILCPQCKNPLQAELKNHAPLTLEYTCANPLCVLSKKPKKDEENG